MSVFNTPVITKIADHDYTVVVKVTQQSNGSVSANTNTTLIVANSTQGANTSQLCALDVTDIQYEMGTSNGMVSLEYVQSGNGAANTTVWVGRGYGSGFVEQLTFNPVESNSSATVSNAVGDINLATYNIGPNDTFALVVTLRKSTFNSGFANVGLAYDSAFSGGPSVVP